MEIQDFGSKISFFKIPLAIFFVGLFVFSVGLGLLIFKGSGSDSELKVLSASDEAAEEADIIVDVGGAVNKPGVYSLKSNSRVNDAVAAAGGLGADADEARVNLAAKVSDGQKVFIPNKLQITNDKKEGLFLIDQKVQNVGGEVISQQNSSLISINNASESELDKLPGVGPVTAGKIINARPYSAIDELVSKKTVTKSVFEKIKDKITI